MRVLTYVLFSVMARSLATAVLVKVLFVREAVRRRLFPVLRPLYKQVLNPFALRDPRRWGVVHHVGRRSGAAYHTPIDAERTTRGVIIPVVYGPGADWCRNILAAGRCTLTLNGEELALTTPQVISIDAAQPSVSPEKGRFWKSIGIERCLSLQLARGTLGQP